MEEDIRYFTTNGKNNMMECKDCDLVLMPENKKKRLFVQRYIVQPWIILQVLSPIKRNEKK